MAVVFETKARERGWRGELTGLAEVLRKVLNLLGGAEGQLVIVKLQKDGCSFRQGQWRQVGFRRWGGLCDRWL